MGSLNSSLAIAVGALQAEQGAINATANNVANVNTPDYSRQVAVFAENDPVVLGSLTLGSGASLQSLQSIRDPVLQLRIEQETQQQSQLNASVTALQQAQGTLQTSSSDVGTQLSNFFSSLSRLSTTPSDVSVRQGVLTAANNLATSFNNAARSLATQRSGLDLSVTQDVQQVNTLTGQIAKLNGQISGLVNAKQNASSLIDSRDQLVTQLSTLVDVASIQTDGTGLTLTTSNGTALVSGTQSFALSTQPTAAGVQDIYSQGKDITSQFASGDLGGLLQVRDQSIPAFQNNLDNLTASFAGAINTANAKGFDLNGAAGGNIFVPPASVAGAALNLRVEITDPKLIAASSDGSIGSNGNVANLSAVHDQTIVSGQTANGYYASIIFDVGNQVSSNITELSSAQSILQQLQDQRGSISGVSLNEEASNLVQYQQAYNAAAKVVTVVDELLGTVINMIVFP